jgi:hypothetical protein
MGRGCHGREYSDGLVRFPPLGFFRKEIKGNSGEEADPWLAWEKVPKRKDACRSDFGGLLSVEYYADQ